MQWVPFLCLPVMIADLAGIHHKGDRSHLLNQGPSYSHMGGQQSYAEHFSKSRGCRSKLVVSNEKQALLTKLFHKLQLEPPKQEFPVRHQSG